MDEHPHSQVDWHRADWPALLSRLTACALHWFKDEGCLEADSVLPGTGVSALDLVYDTVVKLIEDEGVCWRPQSADDDLFPFLLTVIHHDFLDLVKQGRAYKRTVITDANNRSEAQLELGNIPVSANSFDPAEAAALAKKLHTILGDDTELKEYVTAWLVKGLEKRADIAYSLGISLQEVTNRKRRLIYKLKPWRRMFAKAQTGGRKAG